MKHQFQEISVTPVEVIDHPSSSEPVVMPTGPAQFALGCQVCGASYEEIRNKACPGKPQLKAVEPQT